MHFMFLCFSIKIDKENVLGFLNIIIKLKIKKF